MPTRQGTSKSLPGAEDVLLDVPVLEVDAISLGIGDVRARLAVSAEVRELLQLVVGIDVRMRHAQLRIEGVDAQALLEARLDNVARILDRIAVSIDRNPALLRS